MVIGRRSLLLAGAALPVAARTAKSQCVTDTPAIDACRGGVRITQPPGATLDLSFMNPGTMPPGITFTRASTATYFDVTGTLQTAATNVPRWDYDPVTHALNGLLIEDQRTNLMPWSADASVWSALGSGAAAPTVTANQVAAPDGTLTAARVVYPAVSAGGAFSLVYEQFGVTAAPYAFSVWLRGNVGGEQVYIGSNGAVYYSAARITLTTAWQRFVLVTPALTAASWFFDVGTDLRDGSQASTPAQTIYAWGAQVEAGAFGPTSYIPTTAAAVTRQPDVAQITGTNFSSWFTGNAVGSFAVQAMYSVIPPGAGGTGRLIELSDGTTTNFLGMLPSFPTGFQLASTIASVAGTGLVAAAGAAAPGAVVNASAAYSTSRFFCANAGGGAGPSPVVSTAGGIAAVNQLGIGNRPDAGRGLNGCIRRIRYWPRALSAAELQSVTT